MTESEATVVGAAVAALFGLVSGGISSWLFYRTEWRKRSDELFASALTFLDGGSQRRNVGLAQLRLFMHEFPSYNKDVCAEVLSVTATYLLLESEEKDRSHELLNLDRIMTMLLRDLRPSDDTRMSYQALKAAVESRLDGKTVHRSRSEEHTSELQSRENLVCRLLLEK